MADSVEGPHVIIVVKLHLSTNPLNSVESLPSMAAAALAHVGKAKSKGEDLQRKTSSECVKN